MIRLHYKDVNGYIDADENPIKMDWEYKFSHFSDNKVVGIKDILYLDTSYSEAVNIIIEK